jgi:hypothetical protein
MLNVAGYWVGVGQGRSEDTARALGIDRGCQSEEEYGSGEGFGEHLNKEWMKVRRIAALGIDCVERVLLECETEVW